MVVQIITLWGANNYGAFLQAYALGEFIKANVKDAEVKYIEETKEKNTFYSCISKSMKKTVYQLKLRKEYDRARKCFNKKTLKTYADVSVLGADEIWNVRNKHFEHLDAYIGRGLNSGRILTYAACANGTSSEEFRDRYGDDPFKCLDAVSVRDLDTQMMVKEISSIDAPVVLDPTFLLKDYDNIIEEVSYDDYIFVYGYAFSKDEITDIKEFAFKHKLKIISAGAYQPWTDLQTAASPAQFLGLIKKARFVVTSTFHGTVFSIIFNKVFASYCNGNNKITDILRIFNLSHRDASSLEEDLSSILNKAIDYEAVNKLIALKRDESIGYILGEVEKC